MARALGILIFYARESDAHVRRVLALNDALVRADLDAHAVPVGTDARPVTVQGDFDWILLVWSAGLAERFEADIAPTLARSQVGVLFLDPGDDVPLPPALQSAPNMVVDSDAAIAQLIENLDARPAMIEPEEPESAQPPPPPAPRPPSPSPAPATRGPGEDVGASTGDEELEMSGAEPPPDGVVYPVWFGTNRKPRTDRPGFTGERWGETTTGRVDVFIPETHRFGETGTAFWKRLLRFDLRDDHLRIQEIVTLDRDTFYDEVRGALDDAGDEPQALLFIHGFNVTFDEAAIRAAQIGFDLKVQGPTAFFSWPSRGDVKAYSADEASIEASEKAITDFLVEFAGKCQGARIHIIAHSMGNRGLLRALQRIAGNAETRGKVRFDQIFLAAPDVDRDLFVQLAYLYPEHAGRTTLYTSDGDLPVYLSGILHDAPRAGYYMPYTIAPGVDTVAVPDFDVDLLGHSYFAQAEALLYDIHALMQQDAPPTSRQRLTTAQDQGKPFWKLNR
ncbi:MAG: alpha/beta hydrolase [Rhodothermales bacterium]